jgi:Protein of unknown function (DUF3199)
MPLIKPMDVTAYTEFEEIKERNPSSLDVDIMRAESDVFKYCGHKFTDEKYSPLPDEVRTAIILLAEYYALNSMDDASMVGYASEEANGVKYTFSSGKKPEIDNLLSDYVYVSEQDKTKGTAFFRMRRL